MNPYANYGASTSRARKATDSIQVAVFITTRSGNSMPLGASDAPLANVLANAIDIDEEVLETRMVDADLVGDVSLREGYRRRLERLRAVKAASNTQAGASVIPIRKK